MTQPETTTRRVAAIDIARALAVIGVVLNHSIDGLVTAGISDPEGPLAQFNAALYIFRMPALLFLLGIFIPRGVEKRGSVGYIRNRAVTMLYLYFVWWIVQSLTEFATAGLKNSPRDIAVLLAFWEPLAHLWFLPFVVIATIVVVVTAPWKSGTAHWVAFAVIALASLALWGWNSTIIGLRGLSLIVFVAAGAMIGVRRLASLLSGHLWVWCGVGIVALAGFLGLNLTGLVPSTERSAAPLLTDLRSMVAAALGLLVLLAISAGIARVAGLRACLTYVGRATLPIYLAHVMIVAGVRILLEHLGVDLEIVVATVAVVSGVAIPILAAALAPKVGLGWLFDVPRWMEIATRINVTPIRKSKSLVP